MAGSLTIIKCTALIDNRTILMKPPYTHFQISKDKFIRTFNEIASTEDLVWHRDERERVIYVIHVDDGWSFQEDNKLPQQLTSMNSVFRIGAGAYHRLIKGKGHCVLYVEEK